MTDHIPADDPPPLSAEELAALHSFRERRDRCAQMIGVATIEWRRHVEQQERQIERYIQGEIRAHESLLRERGLDPALWVLDGDTGRITPIRGLKRDEA